MANPFTSAQAAQTMPGNDYTVQQNQLLRQQQMAEMLRKQAMEPMGDTQTVGGWAIKKSPLEGLSKIAQALGANYVQRGADEKQTALANRLREQGVTDMNSVMGALNGSPETQAPFQADNPFGEDLGNMQSVTPAVKGDPRQAMALALNSQNPMVQGIGAKLMESQLKAPEWAVGERFTETGMGQKFMFDKHSDKTKDIGGQQAVKNEFVNGQAVNPYTTQTTGNAIPKQPDAPNLASDLLIPGPGGKMIRNSELIGAKNEIARSGASNIKIDNKVGEGLAKEIGPMAADSKMKAEAAIQQINTLDRFDDALNSEKLYVGPAADIKLKGAQIANMLGVSGKDMDEKIANTRTAIQSTAKITLNGRSALKGQGQITDKETDLLKEADSGKINFTAGELKIISGVARRVAKAQYANHARIMKTMNSKPELSGVADFYDAGEMPEDKKANTGVFSDAEKERRYQEFKRGQGK